VLCIYGLMSLHIERMYHYCCSYIKYVLPNQWTCGCDHQVNQCLSSLFDTFHCRYVLLYFCYFLNIAHIYYLITLCIQSERDVLWEASELVAVTILSMPVITVWCISLHMKTKLTWSVGVHVPFFWVAIWSWLHLFLLFSKLYVKIKHCRNTHSRKCGLVSAKESKKKNTVSKATRIPCNLSSFEVVLWIISNW
jgi:hypothetical protein